MRKIALVITLLISTLLSIAQRPLKFEADTAVFSSRSGNGATLQIKNNTANVLGYLRNIGAGTTIFQKPNLQEITDNGNVTTQDILIQSGLGHDLSLTASNVIWGQTFGPYSGSMSLGTLTADRIWKLPNRSGVIPLFINGEGADSAGNIALNNVWKTSGNLTLPGLGYFGTNSFTSIRFITSGIDRGRLDSLGKWQWLQYTNNAEGDSVLSTDAAGNVILKSANALTSVGLVQTDNLNRYVLPLSPTVITDSMLVSELNAGTTSYYYNKGLWLNGNFAGALYDSRLIAYRYGYLMNQQFSQKLIFQVGDSSSNFNLGIGIKAGNVPGMGFDMMAYLNGSIGSSSTLGNSTYTHTATKSGVVMNYKDIIELQLNLVNDSLVVYYRNISTNTSLSVSRKVDFTSASQFLTICGYPTIYFAKGNIRLISYSISDNPNFNYLFLGNSITSGSRARYDSSFVNQLRQYTGSVINNAAKAGAASADFLKMTQNLSFQNKTVFLSGIMGNDPTNSVSASQSKANYRALVDRIRANGNRIVHIDNPYRATFLGGGGWPELNALNLWLDSTYKGRDTIVHLNGLLTYPGDYEDGTHQNLQGHTKIANKILHDAAPFFELQPVRTVPSLDTTNYKVEVVDSSGSKFKIFWSALLSPPVSAPGNYGNVTINRNGLSSSPGLDTLSYNSGVLGIKGGISFTQQLVNTNNNTSDYQIRAGSAYIQSPYDDYTIYGSNLHLTGGGWYKPKAGYSGALIFSNSGYFYLGSTNTNSAGGQYPYPQIVGNYLNQVAIGALYASTDVSNATMLIDGGINKVKIGAGTTPAQALDVAGTIRQTNVTSAMVKANSSGDLVAAVAGTDYALPTNIVEISGTSQSAAINTIYIPHNSSLTTITLPSSAAVGSLLQIIGEGSGKWKLAQNASQYVVGVGGAATTTGTGGYIQASDANCTLTIRCTATNKWTVTTSQGTITFN